jgi:HK97 family phage prohead protease
MRIAGYAALFDVVDRGGDVVRAGAFGTVEPQRVPLLWQHDPARPIGVIERAEEDRRGLRVVARLSGASSTAKEAAALLAEGAVSGLSFGYRVKRSEPGPPGKGGVTTRALTALELVEVSLVTLPMQPGARVIALEP